MRWMLPALAMLAARPLAAQASQERDGLWWAFGLGYGSYHHACDRCARPAGTTETTAAWLAAGATIDRRVTLGVELASGHVRSGTHVTGTSLVATVYPAVDKGWLVRVGAGTSSYRQRLYADYPPFRGSGWGWSVGVGCDLRIDRRLSFTPMVTYRAGAPGTVVAFQVDTAAVNLRQRAVTFTVGFTFH